MIKRTRSNFERVKVQKIIGQDRVSDVAKEINDFSCDEIIITTTHFSESDMFR